MGRVLPYGFGGPIADCPRDSNTKSEIWMAMDIGRSSLISGTEKNQRISGDFCWKIICSHGNRRWRRSVLPQAGGAPCPTFTSQGEQCQWLVILIFKWKLRQFGETLRKTRQILENDETLRKTGIMQGIPALHDYQWIFASLLIWM